MPLVTHRQRLANTSAVYKEFYEAAYTNGLDLVEFEYRALNSLVNARNALVHDRGIVTLVRLRGEGAMTLTWPGRDMFIVRKNGLREPMPPQRGHRVRKQDVGCLLDDEKVVRTRSINVGDRITFEPYELAEIIFFYQDLSINIVKTISWLVQEIQASKADGLPISE